MNRILSFTFGVAMPLAMFAQGTVPSTYGSRSGFGSVLYPGTGHAPVQAPIRTITHPAFPGGFGTNVRSYTTLPQVAHPSHGRRVVVPYPVFVGGYYGGFDTPPAYYQEPVQYGPPQVQQQPPVVIINQAYRPETANPVMRDYSDAQLPEPTIRTYEAPVHPTPDPKERAAARAESERPTIYLIAMNDHSIIPALAYWMEGDTLNYVTREGKPNRVSLALVDKDFSRQLNRERQVEFSLP